MPPKKKEYVPTHSSAGYAVLVALSFDEQTGREYWTKEEICDLAYPKWTSTVMNGNPPKRKAGPGHFAGGRDSFDGWSSVSSTLIKSKGLMETINRKPSEGIHKRMYKLTEAGRELGKKLVMRDNLDPIGPSTAMPPAPPPIPAPPSIAYSTSISRPGIVSSGGRNGASGSSSSSSSSSTKAYCVDLTSDNENDDDDKVLASPKKQKVDEKFVGSKGVMVFGDTWNLVTALDWSHCEEAPHWYQKYLNFGHSRPSVFSGQNLLFQEFDLILFVDKSELNHISRSLDKKKEVACRNLAQMGITMDIEDRALKVGDYLWVLRHKFSDHELVLDYIVERKSYGDLWHSIAGKSASTVRYYEQKRRIVYSGISNRYYLVEGRIKDIVENSKTMKPAEQKMATIMGSKVQSQLDGFRLMYTVNTEDTVDKLLSLTRQIGLMMRGYRAADYMNKSYFKKVDFLELQQKAAILKRSVSQISESMVYQMSGVGKVTAQQVCAQYSTLAELMATLERGGDTVQSRTEFLSKGTGVSKEKARKVVQVLTTMF